MNNDIINAILQIHGFKIGNRTKVLLRCEKFKLNSKSVGSNVNCFYINNLFCFKAFRVVS